MALKISDIAKHLFRPPGFGPAPWLVTAENRFVAQALERHKKEGLELAVRARTWAMIAIGLFILTITPWPAVLFYEAVLALFILIGLAQRRVGSVGHNRWELALLFADLALMTAVCVVPNPLDGRELPLGFQYRFDTFLYFFTILAAATLAYSWQTLIAAATWTGVLWAAAACAVWALQDDQSHTSEALAALFPDEPVLAEFANPFGLLVELRIQEIVVFVIVATILAISMRRFQQLVLREAEAERGRANLSRYFSPNVVAALSENDEPLRDIRSQEIAVLFVDIAGFTAYAAERSPERVIQTLRGFHALMGAEVFRHNGTLDKFLGDGLMATFGTPSAGQRDAANAVECALAMQIAVSKWNEERVAKGSVVIDARFGLHFGPVVLGDIGANRLEFAVIGNTVNVASRLEALTRHHNVQIIASNDIMQQAAQDGIDRGRLQGFVPVDDQPIRGIETHMRIWTAD